LRTSWEKIEAPLKGKSTRVNDKGCNRRGNDNPGSPKLIKKLFDFLKQKWPVNLKSKSLMMNTKKLITLCLLLCAGAATGQKIPDKVVVLTFDDACISHYTYVAPLLKKYGFDATFYVCEFPGWPDSTKYMSWAQIQQLSKWGFEIGNHTWHHQNVDEVNEVSLRKEIAYMEYKCDSLHIAKPTSFDYPAYHTSDTAVRVLKAMGYQTARIGDDRVYDPQKDNPLLLPSFTLLKDNQQLFYDALSQAKDGKVVVFTIHGVPDVAHPWVSVPPELFSSYMQYLHDHHYKVISMRQLEKMLKK
jgi:peptidoglycan/xylan/chitin deacetylase (PgdA/CDA1 family)